MPLLVCPVPGSRAVGEEGIGSGGAFAAAAAKALLGHTQMTAREIVDASLRIAGEICIYTNANVRVETVE